MSSRHEPAERRNQSVEQLWVGKMINLDEERGVDRIKRL
jgi:hypothetical protein